MEFQALEEIVEVPSNGKNPTWTQTLQRRGGLMHMCRYLMLQQEDQEAWSYFSFLSPTPRNVLFLEKIEGSGKTWFIPLMMWSGLILLIYNAKE